MTNIEKMSPEDVTNTILTFSDPNLVSSLFNRLGWGVTEEIKETLTIARQNQNLAAKLSAIKYLRLLVKESAEASGMIGSVSKSFPGKDGSVTTFSAKNISTALNPRKQIKSEEINNDRKEEEQTDAGGGSEGEPTGGRTDGADRGRDSDSSSGRGGGTGETDTTSTRKRPDCGTNNKPDDGQSITKEGPHNGGKQEVNVGGHQIRSHDNKRPDPSGDDFEPAGDSDDEQNNIERQPGGGDNPCIQHRTPTCRQDLYPGVSGNRKDDNTS